jgi:hypothetical protein
MQSGVKKPDLFAVTVLTGTVGDSFELSRGPLSFLILL